MDFEARVRVFQLPVGEQEHERLMRYSVRCGPLRRGVLDAAVHGTVDYGPSLVVEPFVGEGPEHDRARTIVGRPAPDPRVGPDGTVRLGAKLSPDALSVLLFRGHAEDPRVDERLAFTASRLSERFPERVRPILVLPPGGSPTGFPGEIVPDAGGALHHRYGCLSDAAFVVRPDGYVGYGCAPVDAERLVRHVSRILWPT